MNVHARINRRANQANYNKCYFDGAFGKSLFKYSFDNNGAGIEEELYAFKRRGVTYYN